MTTKLLSSALILISCSVLFQACDIFTDYSISCNIATSPSAPLSARYLNLQAQVSNPSSTTLTYSWYFDDVLAVSGGESAKAVYTAKYTESPTIVNVKLVVSNSKSSSSTTKKVTVTPYSESDAASVTIRNGRQANIYQIIISEFGSTYGQIVGNNVLKTAYLAPGAQITLTGLIPGSYGILGLDYTGQNPAGGSNNVYFVAGQNSYTVQ